MTQRFDFVKTENRMNGLGDVQPNTNPGPGFWMTFVVRITASFQTPCAPCAVRLTWLLLLTDFLPTLLCRLRGALRPQEGTLSPWRRLRREDPQALL